MTLNAPWAYFVLVIIVLAVVALPLFRLIENPVGVSVRYAAIDGLRGFLALSVFVFHLLVMHQFIATGVWDVPASRFYALLGPIGVSLFFMITGFLFWGKMLRVKGRPRWGELYIGRLFRIGPMYLFVVLIMFWIVFARTGFVLHEPIAAVATSVMQWLALGMIDTQPDVNGVRATHVLAGVTWTIWYEWLFYVSLLLTAWFTRGRLHGWFVSGALVACLAGKIFFKLDAVGFAVLFLSGMAVASLLHENLKLRVPDNISSAIAVACMAMIFVFSHSGYGTVTAMLLTLFFYLVCSGSSLFGLLLTMPARRLGNISYSLYLMQGLVLTLVFGMTPIRNFAMTSPQQYWLIGIVCAGLLLLGAALGYVCIERPGIAFGKGLIRRRARRQAGNAAPVTSTPASQ